MGVDADVLCDVGLVSIRWMQTLQPDVFQIVQNRPRMTRRQISPEVIVLRRRCSRVWLIEGHSCSQNRIQCSVVLKDGRLSGGGRRTEDGRCHFHRPEVASGSRFLVCLLSDTASESCRAPVQNRRDRGKLCQLCDRNWIHLLRRGEVASTVRGFYLLRRGYRSFCGQCCRMMHADGQ